MGGCRFPSRAQFVSSDFHDRPPHGGDPPPRDHRAQPLAAILERQMHLAELLRREGGDAAGCASPTTTAGTSQRGERIVLQGE